MPEPTLIDRVRAGDPGAQRELYDAHVDRVYRLALRISGDAELAREFTQDAFVRVLQRIGDFRGECALATWIQTIAVSVTLNGLRRQNRIRAREVGLAMADDVAADADAVEPDEKARLRRAIAALPESYRIAFLMHELEGYSHEEIARVLNVAAGTSRSLVSRARTRLRQALDVLSAMVAL